MGIEAPQGPHQPKVSLVDLDGILCEMETSPALAVQLPDRSIDALVVDPHATARIGLGVLLQRQPWIAHCMLATSHRESVTLAGTHRPDIAILDISDVGPFAATVTGSLRAAHPAIQIVLSSHCSISSNVSPASVGASAALAPGAGSEEIVDTIRAVLVSDTAFEAPLGFAQPTGLAGHGLTAREHEVLLLLGTGATNHEIASEPHLSADSIKKYTMALYRKLGVRNRTEAARRAAVLLDAA